jgi:hypothetical protein
VFARCIAIYSNKKETVFLEPATLEECSGSNLQPLYSTLRDPGFAGGAGVMIFCEKCKNVQPPSRKKRTLISLWPRGVLARCSSLACMITLVVDLGRRVLNHGRGVSWPGRSKQKKGADRSPADALRFACAVRWQV